MKQFAGSDSRLRILGENLRRFSVFVLVAASFGVMLLGKADNIIIEKSRMIIVDTMTPVMAMLAKPVGKVTAFLDNIRELAQIRSENARLRKENRQLLQWQAATANGGAASV